jgi:PilZ domain
MKTTHPVLIVDDGELDDVRDTLAELKVDFALLRGGAIPNRVDAPSRLFVATPRRAMLAQHWPMPRPGESGPMRVGIVAEDSNTLRTMLRRLGFHLLIRRPVNPFALRLILLRAVYSGEERRQEERVPIGAPASYRVGLFRRPGTIAELSLRGGRLLTESPPRAGARMTLQITLPDSPRTLSLRTHVVRISHEPVMGKQHVVAFSIDHQNRGRDLQRLLEHYRSGPAQVAGRIDPESDFPAERVLPLAAPASDSERRKHERVLFDKEVVGLSEEAATVLFGRDLSIGGMRVAGNPQLELGMRLRLAVFGAPREEPILVRAEVTRADDGSHALRFVDVAPDVASRLEKLVAHLPSVEPLDLDEVDGLGAVVTRIVGRD